MSEPVAVVDRVSVAYGRGPVVLNDVSLRVAHGEAVGIIGETGSGKTTLARTLLGLTRIVAGRVTVAGHDIARLRGRRLRAARREGLAHYVYQDPLRSLDPDLPVGVSVAEGLAVRGVPRAEQRRRVDQALADVGLAAELASRLPGELSGGQRQRVAVARVLVLDPRLVIFDEPVSALDAVGRLRVLDLIRSAARRASFAQLFISHDLGSVAAVADRVVVIHRGRIVDEGLTSEVISHPHHPYTRLLIESAPTLHTSGAARERRADLRREVDDAPYLDERVPA